jgi:probable phosphoglycerate mutase
MLCSILGIDVGRFRDRVDIPMGALSIVEMTEHGPLVRVTGDHPHVRVIAKTVH